MTTLADRLVNAGTQLVSDSVQRGMRTGLDAVESMRDRRTACACEIPPPCWYPRHAGDVHSLVCAGGRAILRVQVENCGPRPATVTVAGGDKADFEVENGTLELGPMERETAVVRLDVSSGEHDELVWVRGCHDHFIRWTVTETRLGRDACHEVEVKDCPDYLHHWYDHFYCVHPCPGHAGRER
jgi:hypothetical protein